MLQGPHNAEPYADDLRAFMPESVCLFCFGCHCAVQGRGLKSRSYVQLYNEEYKKFVLFGFICH